MAVVVNTTLKADTSKAVEEIEKVNDKLKETQKEAKKTGEEISEGMVIGNAAVKQIDKVTGGLASALVKVGKAAKKSGKAMRIALLSTGIGAVVIAVGLLVQYWDEIGEALGFINKDLEKQVELNKRNLELTSDQLSNLDLRIKLGKKQGKNVDDLIAKRKILVGIQKQQILDSIANLKLQKQELEVDAKKLTIWERISQAFVKTKDQASEITEEEKEAIKLKEKEITDLENRLLNIEIAELPDAVKDTSAADAEAAEKARLEAIERIRKGLIDTEAEERAEKLRLIKEDYTEQIELAAKYYGTNSIKILELKAAQKKAEDEQQAVFDEQDKAKQDKIDQEAKDKEKKRLEDIQKIVNDATELSEIQKLEREKASALAELDLLEATWIEKARIAAYYENQIAGVVKENKEEEEKDEAIKRNAQLDMAKNTLGDISTLFDEQSAASKAAAAAAALINTYQGITAELATKTVTPFEFGLKIANIATTAAIGFKSVKDILKTSPSNARGGTNPASGASGGSQAPAFNVVGASGETQLADAIGSQTQRPSRAYVVSNDVTTAQELDRNIIEGASIG